MRNTVIAQRVYCVVWSGSHKKRPNGRLRYISVKLGVSAVLQLEVLQLQGNTIRRFACTLIETTLVWQLNSVSVNI